MSGMDLHAVKTRFLCTQRRLDKGVLDAVDILALEDMYGFTIASYDGDNVIRLGKKNGKVDPVIFEMLEEWKQQKSRYLDGVISKEEYDDWRYHYPASSTSSTWQHMPPEISGLSSSKDSDQ